MKYDFKNHKKPIPVKIETNQLLFTNNDGVRHYKFYVGYLLADTNCDVHIIHKMKNTNIQQVVIISKDVIKEVHFIEPPFELVMNSTVKYYKNCFQGGWNNKNETD